MPMDGDNVRPLPASARPISGGEDVLRRQRAAMTALWRANVGFGLASGQAAMCGVQELTAALLAFLQSRSKDSLTVAAQIATCDSPEAALEIQRECGKAMLQAWSDDLARLSALTGRIMISVMAPSRQRAAVAGPTSSGRSGAERGAGALAA